MHLYCLIHKWKSGHEETIMKANHSWYSKISISINPSPTCNLISALTIWMKILWTRNSEPNCTIECHGKVRAARKSTVHSTATGDDGEVWSSLEKPGKTLSLELEKRAHLQTNEQWSSLTALKSRHLWQWTPSPRQVVLRQGSWQTCFPASETWSVLTVWLHQETGWNSAHTTVGGRAPDTDTKEERGRRREEGTSSRGEFKILQTI